MLSSISGNYSPSFTLDVYTYVLMPEKIREVIWRDETKIKT